MESANSIRQFVWRTPPGSYKDVQEVMEGHAASALRDPVSLYGAAVVYLHERSGQERNEGRMLLWAAASLGSTKAARRLAREIHDHLEFETSDLMEDFFLRMTALSEDWLKRSADAVYEQSAAAAGKVIVSEIADRGSRDGKELSARYGNVVGKSFPWVGSIPRPGVAMKEILNVWPWAEAAALAVERQLDLVRLAQASSGSPRLKLRPLLIVGPPSAGKTRFARTIFDILKLPSMLISSSGTPDSAGLAPISRGWSTQRPSGPVVFMCDRGVCNPGVILDELDKSLGVNARNGSVLGTVTGMLSDPERYYDACLMAETDLSGLSFIATANSLSGLPDFILERFRVIEMPRPSGEHFPVIFQTMKEIIAAEIDVDPLEIPSLDGEEMAVLTEFFDNGNASLRALRRAYEFILGEAHRRTPDPVLN